MSADYSTIVSQSRQLRETNDCAVIAAAIVTGYEEDYEGVHWVFEGLGRRPRCGTQWEMTKKAIRLLGCELHNVTDMFKERTVRTLERRIRHNKGTYLVRTGGRTNGHALAIKDGKVIDHSSGSCRRIKEIYKILPKEA